MKKIWICANGTHPFYFVNKRKGGSTSTGVAGSLSTLGELVYGTGNHIAEGENVWHQYQSINADEVFWVRSDVHKRAVFEAESKKLNVPFVDQNSPSASLSANDCGPASSAMLLQYDGVDVDVPSFMAAAGISHRDFTHIDDNMRGIKQYGYRPVFSRPMHLPTLINLVQHKDTPVFCLVHYHHLYPGKNFGHFLVFVGYSLHGNKLKVVVHDPNRRAFMEFSSEDWLKAHGYINSNDNLPFQAIHIGDYKNIGASDPVERPTDSEFDVDAALKKIDEMSLALAELKNMLTK